MSLQKHYYFYFFVIALFLGITAANLFSDGMFMDGLLYADVSRNMAEGLGSFWRPHLSYGLLDEFYEHPPLAFGLQSLFFKLFGDSILVERFYSLITVIVVGYLMVLIWGHLTGDRKNAWIPIFLWVIIPNVSWAASNNMLENTMSVFVVLSVLFYVKKLKNSHLLWVVLAGVSLSLGLLTKGFICLYIWGVPFFVWVFKRPMSFLQMCKDTFILILFTALPIAFLYFMVPAAQNNMLQYFNIQVLTSVQHVQTVNSRFAIISMFLQNIIVPLIIALVIIGLALKKQVKSSVFTSHLKEALVFLAIVLSGVLPVMISMKQSGFYILTVYPLFALGLAYYLYPIICPFIDTLKTYSRGFVVFKGITIGMLMVSIGISIVQMNRVGRDHDMIYDVKTIIDVVGKDNTVNICPNMRQLWSLHGYFSRYGNVSLQVMSQATENTTICEYYVAVKACNKAYLDSKYDIVPIPVKEYQLYKRKLKK